MRHVDSPPSDAHTLFEAFLAALGDADGGARLYRLHAPEAPVRHGAGLQHCSRVDETSFARAHGEISRRGQDVLPLFSLSRCLAVPEDPGASRSVAWFETKEQRQQTPLITAVGVETAACGPRVGWCTLASRIEPWTYTQGLLHSLSDYTWMRRTEPAPARALLDASYFRRHWRAPVELSTLPDARFSCRMSTVCCRNDFDIALAPEAQLVIDAVPWEGLEPRLAGTRLSVRADGKLQLKTAGEACRFLGARQQCLMHQAVGHQPFDTCAIFPYTFARTPDGVAVALSPVCPSARQGLGLAPLACEDDLRDRLAQAEPRECSDYRLAPNRPIVWEDFRQIETGLLSCLAAHELPLRRRLFVGTQMLGALLHNRAFTTAQWLVEPIPAITQELRAAIHGMLGKILRWDRHVLRALPPAPPSELATLEVRDPDVVARILQNMLFSKTYSYQYDLTTAFNFAVLLYLLALVMQAAVVPAPLPDRHWQELGSLGVHGLLKDVLHEGLPDGFRSVLGTSEFGHWMLAA